MLEKWTPKYPKSIFLRKNAHKIAIISPIKRRKIYLKEITEKLAA